MSAVVEPSSAVATPTPETQPAGTSTNGGLDIYKKQDGKQNKGNKSRRTDFNSTLKDFVGLEKEFGLVLGLSSENVSS